MWGREDAAMQFLTRFVQLAEHEEKLKKQRRLAQFQEALDRSGLRYEHGELLTADGEVPTPEHKIALAAALEAVHAEADAVEAEQARLQEAAAAEAAAKKAAEAAELAAPYREERRRQKAEAWAKRNKT
jgi:hypothetical protein